MENREPVKTTWSAYLAVSTDRTLGNLGDTGPITTAGFHTCGRGGSVQYKWNNTGAGIGTVTMEVSNNGTDWDQVIITLASPNNNSASYTAEIPRGIDRARLKYARSSGGTGGQIEAWFKQGQ